MRKIDQYRTRSKQIVLRTTEKEFELIQEKVEKSKLKQNEFLLNCALQKDIIVIDGLRDLLLELVREGKNLNQIARALNQKDDFYLNEITKLKEKLTDLWGTAEEILKEVKK
ncbi:plasmid mobilization relaxosome protein MobC [Clostridium algoriphilum]|uniref:plasmid mobilization protein n=1 Tax=Clostridium algoriphilum TaxID=198347 RepID=UPI001CF22C3D|nr:plasmid mobilization relaxosome protein MobC [Clostridium algoriphilum]MCB2295951.1 plasmid mobilization relaxosome protein MobC [Clostridium algoriphilum]